MSIISDTATEEASSHLYKLNKELCKNWEHYVLSRKGEINGSFSESSYSLEGKVKSKMTWSLEIEKEAGSKRRQRLGEKKTNAKESITISTFIEETGCEKFYIKNGVVKRGGSDHGFYKSIIHMLMEVFHTSDIYEAFFEDDILTIVIHFKNNRFNLVDEILDYTYPPEVED